MSMEAELCLDLGNMKSEKALMRFIEGKPLLCQSSVLDTSSTDQIQGSISACITKKDPSALKGSIFYMYYMHNIFTQKKQYKQKREVMH